MRPIEGARPRAAEAGVLGLLPAAGGGLAPLEATGQAGRLIDYYFRTYLRTFRRLFYFSYRGESLADYTDDARILERVSLIPRHGSMPYRLYACLLPFLARSEFRACSVLRVFQATGAAPAMTARLLYGIPYVITYGYRYHAVARVEGRRLSSACLRVLEPLALRMAEGVIVTTQELSDYVRRFVADGRVHLIPNGVDTGSLRLATALLNDPTGPLLSSSSGGWCGRRTCPGSWRRRACSTGDTRCGCGSSAMGRCGPSLRPRPRNWAWGAPLRARCPTRVCPTI